MAASFLYRRVVTADESLPPDALPVKVGTHAQGISVQVTCGVFMALSWIAVLLRLYTRGILVRNIGADDIWILLAAIFFTIYNVACIVCAGATMGDIYLRVYNVDLTFDTLMVAEAFYVVTMCALKVSVSIFFLRVMVKPWQRWVIYISLFLATAVNLAYFFVIIFQCGVPKGGMRFLMKQLQHQCLKREEFLAASYAHGVITTVTDIGFAILPVTIFRESRLGLRERLIVVGILMLAAAGGVASMVRLNYIPRLATATQTWFMDANLIAIWSAVEPGLGIISSSLATLRPLLRGLFNMGSSSLGSSFNNNGAGGVGGAYARFASFKTATVIEELPVRSKDGEGGREASPYDSFEFIQGGVPALKGVPVGPHQHIPKEPWRPTTAPASAPAPTTAPAHAPERRAPSRMGKAEELLGEDLSTFITASPVPAPIPRHLIQLGNSTSCEGGPEKPVPSPDQPKVLSRSNSNRLSRSNSKCKVTGLKKV